jgi:hypothetical protein
MNAWLGRAGFGWGHRDQVRVRVRVMRVFWGAESEGEEGGLLTILPIFLGCCNKVCPVVLVEWRGGIVELILIPNQSMRLEHPSIKAARALLIACRIARCELS